VHELSPALSQLLLVHQLVGYPLVFLVAPLALASFAGRPPHRKVGIAYLVGMSFLYATGSVLTLTQYEYASWEFGRNIVFNLSGYLLALQGARAIWLWRNTDAPRPTPLDHTLRTLFIASTAVMFALAVQKNTALRVFALLAIVLLVLDRADFRAGLTKAVLYARHVRCILGSYFYILTVVSLVHLRDEVGANARWLWPTAAGLLVIWIAHGAATPGNPWRARKSGPSERRWCSRSPLGLTSPTKSRATVCCSDAPISRRKPSEIPDDREILQVALLATRAFQQRDVLK
jgi:hypothetical protein